MTDTIKSDKFVSLTYTITDENDEILERIDMPVNYVHGRDSQVIEKVEQALEGCAQGDEISVELSPEEGFGEHQAELTFTDNIDNVPAEFRHVGAEVEFQNDKGESRMFRVSRIEDDKLTVARARKIQRFLSQPFHVAEQFTGMKGRYVKVEDTIKGFKMLVNGELDDLPEQAFLYVGGIEEAIEKAEKMKAED